MGNYENILYETDDDQIATITLNRPDQMNAISPDLERELHEALDEANADDSVRVIIITGNGRAFSAGYDLGREREGIDTRSEALKQWMPTDMNHTDHVMHLMELDKPIIAAVNGWALGGGFWYTLACDITIASEQAAFGQPEVRMVSNTSFLFPALVGWKVAARYALTGDHFGPEEAVRIGAINEVVPHDQLMTRAREMAMRLVMVPSDSVRLNKKLTTLGFHAMGLRNALQTGGLISILAHASTDAKEVADLYEVQRNEGLTAFLRMRDNKFIPEPGGPRSR
ncbi:MAG: enoyl-CoA hydratase/isomerase family protein [Chloroflexota bacterium]|nr:enoyl-CoA hydratase/isomerase family protein [Chloroflexota bacterium]MDE2696957.1 enoyl-CoA hydratase/isomerase family protein [Chloroflexota bacterium]MXZ62027.1 enoyl-CoA hydratase/isomerase family protein [Chloroflexota bacterium]